MVDDGQVGSGPATNGRAAPIQLAAEDVHLRFGGVVALAGVSLGVRQGEIAAIIGPNGAGKTSLLNAFSGLYPLASGRLVFDGRDIAGLKPHRVARLGIARTFQNIELFKGMTVLDNLMLGRHVHLKTNLLSSGLYWGAAQREEVANREIVEDVIDFLEIEAIRKRTVGTLAYGLQKRVELGRALAMQPRLLLLDEPMAGMSQEDVERNQELIRRVAKNRTILMVEHNLSVVASLSDTITVLARGNVLAEGNYAAVSKDPRVIEAYIGAGHG